MNESEAKAPIRRITGDIGRPIVGEGRENHPDHLQVQDLPGNGRTMPAAAS